MNANKIKPALKHSYLFFLGIGTAFLIFYCVYFFSETINTALNAYDKIFGYLAHISALLFTAGLFTASLKYIQLLEVFKDEFHQAIESSAFDTKLKSHLKQITFSNKYLLEQANLRALWEKMTLCMYRKNFPEIYKKVKKKVKNDLFEKSSLSYYYKNFQINYKVSLVDNDYIHIVETVSYTLMRPSKEEFIWDFGFAYDKTNDPKVYVNVEGVVNNTKDKINKEDQKTIDNDEKTGIKITKKLSGHVEYHIERKLEISQNINFDRIHSFSTDKIIDDFSVNIVTDKKAIVYFTPVNNNKFYSNGAFPESDSAFINRDIFLPGEKFILFFTRKH